MGLSFDFFTTCHVDQGPRGPALKFEDDAALVDLNRGDRASRHGGAGHGYIVP